MTVPRVTIGELARRAGVGIETVRFYERNGLLPSRPESGRGWHRYSAETVERLKFIRRARGLGFSTKEVEELLALASKRGATCAAFRDLLERRRIDLEVEQCEVAARLEEVKSLMHACIGKGAVENCKAYGALLK